MRTYTLLLSVFFVFICGNRVDERLKYLKQKPPSTVSEIFAPNIISKEGEYEFGSVFNNNATEFFYGVTMNGKEEIRYSKLIGNNWSKPKTILTHKQYGYNDPFLSPDENRLYFISRRALDGLGKPKDYDIWYVERIDNQWSDPINAGPKINSDANEYYISFTKDGTMYFSSNKVGSNFDIYSSKVIDGEFQKAIPLNDSINTPAYEADVFIAPDESYIIFCATRQDGLGRGDLYISFKNTDGTWAKSVNMGERINTKNHELCPFVSKDGKYLFYTSNQDIYWVSAEILESYKELK
ncbi:MAG: glycoside hydrolase [Flavobacteriaceae bacterium]|nr:glycoside hydrolase [Flavobacteriaceae bacterium]